MSVTVESSTATTPQEKEQLRQANDPEFREQIRERQPRRVIESSTASKEEIRKANDPVEREKMRDASQESRRQIDSITASQEELDSAINAATERRAKEKWTPEMQKTFDKAFKKTADRLTRRRYEAEERATAAEKRLAEIESGKASGQEPQPSSAGEQQSDAREAAELQTRVEAAKAKYSDYEQVILAADKSGVQVPHDFGQALKKLPNSADVAYLLAKQPNVIGEVMSRLRGLTGADHASRAAQLAQEIGQRVEHSQQFPRAQQFNEKLAALKTERGFKPLDANKSINIHMDAVRVLHEAENGPEVVLHLAENVGEAEAISKMPPARQALAIAKLSAKLEAGQREAPRTRVNPPPKVVGGSANTSGFDPYTARDSEMDHKKFMSWRKTQGRRN